MKPSRPSKKQKSIDKWLRVKKDVNTKSDTKNEIKRENKGENKKESKKEPKKGLMKEY